MHEPASHRWKITVALVVICGALGLAAIAFFSPQKAALVSFTYDDASTSQYSIAFKIAQKYNLPGSLFVPTKMVSSASSAAPDSWSMTWDNIREMSNAGWEIGSHSRTHPRLTELSPEALNAEIVGSRQDIIDQIGIAPVTFSSPFGDFNSDTLSRIMESYTYHVSWKGHGGRLPVGNFKNRYIGRLEVTNQMTATEVCGEMEEAARKNLWLVLLFHSIVEGTPGDYEISASVVEDIYACARFLEDQGIIRVEPVRIAAKILEHRR